MSTTAAQHSTIRNDEVSRARENDNIPPMPQTPLDQERGNGRVGQANGEPHSPKSAITQGQTQAQAPAWNSAHPCYPHINPHVPLSSPLIHTTRVIRVPRNWMAAGDVYPAFSNVYPEILAPWVPEIEFRKLIEGLNTRLANAFDPTGARAWVDGLMGCLSGWIWEDLGLNKSKSGMREIERFIEKWNQDRRANSHADDADLVECIQLRRTGLLSIDIVIPDPKVMVVNEAHMKNSQAVAAQS